MPTPHRWPIRALHLANRNRGMPDGFHDSTNRKVGVSYVFRVGFPRLLSAPPHRGSTVKLRFRDSEAGVESRGLLPVTGECAHETRRGRDHRAGGLHPGTQLAEASLRLLLVGLARIIGQPARDLEEAELTRRGRDFLRVLTHSPQRVERGGPLPYARESVDYLPAVVPAVWRTEPPRLRTWRIVGEFAAEKIQRFPFPVRSIIPRAST